MLSRAWFYTLIALLIITGLTLTGYRLINAEIPLTPGETRQIWEIDANIAFEADGEAATVSLAIPQNQAGFSVLSQTAASPGFGLSFVERDGAARAEWSKRQVAGRQLLFFKTQIMVDEFAAPTEVKKPYLRDVVWQEPLATAVNSLIMNAQQKSADPFSFSRQLLQQLHSDNNQDAQLLISEYPSRSELMLDILNTAGIPAQVVRALRLEDGRRKQQLFPLVQVFSDDGSQFYNAQTAEEGKGEHVIIWEQHGQALLDVIGGSQSKVTFAMVRSERSATSAVRQKLADDSLLDFSIQALPVEEQAVFKTILLIPIGVLVVVFMRLLVGIKTSGTFMPVLIAMAFIQTSLFTGLLGFLAIVGVGLFLRSYLSKLNLLLVARVAAVVIVVIMMIGIFSVVAFKLQVTEVLKITMFPMIILAWTIERMSLIWEEEGPKEVLTQGGGSLMVAVLAYLAMDNPLIRHWTFNFIGLQLIVLALVLLMGSYAGYRLSELRRFKHLAEGQR